MASPAPNRRAKVPLPQGRTAEPILDILCEAAHGHDQASRRSRSTARASARRGSPSIRGREIQKTLAWIVPQPGDRYSGDDLFARSGKHMPASLVSLTWSVKVRDCTNYSSEWLDGWGFVMTAAWLLGNCVRSIVTGVSPYGESWVTVGAGRSFGSVWNCR